MSELAVALAMAMALGSPPAHPQQSVAPTARAAQHKAAPHKPVAKRTTPKARTPRMEAALAM